LDTSVSYFCRCNDHSKIIKEVESILFSLSLILAIASKVFSLAGLTRFIILAPDPYFQKKKKKSYQIYSSMSVKGAGNKSVAGDDNKSISSDLINFNRFRLLFDH